MYVYQHDILVKTVVVFWNVTRYFVVSDHVDKMTGFLTVVSSLLVKPLIQPATQLQSFAWGMGSVVCGEAFVPLLTVHMNGAGPECPI